MTAEQDKRCGTCGWWGTQDDEDDEFVFRRCRFRPLTYKTAAEWGWDCQGWKAQD